MANHSFLNGDSSYFMGLFSTRREMIEWFSAHPPGPDTDWVEVCTWIAIKREIDEGRAKIPEDLAEPVAGAMMIYWLDSQKGC